jgi:hypothetical protein
MVGDRLESAPNLELIIVSHIDADHIAGILNALESGTAIRTADIWFNAWRHLPTDLLGVEQGERLSDVISSRGLLWNDAFEGGPVEVGDTGPLPRVSLPGGMVLTLLSPTRRELAALAPVWKREVEKAGLVPGVSAEPERPPDSLGEEPLDFPSLARSPFRDDRSVANGASIAVVAEHEGKSLLLTGDARAPVLEAQQRRLAEERGGGRLAIDAVKLPHHGSLHNLSAGMLDAIECSRWIVSTNGSIFGHPDPETIARLVVDRPSMELVFNYRVETTDRFDSSTLRRKHGYVSIYPEGDPGIAIDI